MFNTNRKYPNVPMKPVIPGPEKLHALNQQRSTIGCYLRGIL